jgi:TRAP-type mannitol/chloroaromatic compound transport system substrate-binding protein
MDRRQFVAGASVGIASSASAFPKPALAQGVRELKMVTIWPKTLPGLQSSAERVAQSITALSGKRAWPRIDLYNRLPGTGGNPRDVVAAHVPEIVPASETTRRVRR